MSTALRFAPGFEPLWRDERTLQFGVSGTVRLRDPAPWIALAVAALGDGCQYSDLVALARTDELGAEAADELLRRLAPALVADPTERPLSVWSLSDAIDGIRVSYLADALRSAGVVQADDAPQVLVIAPRVLLPVVTRDWMREGRVHCPVIVSPASITAGPVIVPGVTACASCLSSARAAADPAWPRLISQLLAQPLPLPPASLYGIAVEHALRLLDERDASDPRSRSVTLGVGIPPLWADHRPNEDCGCRSPAESATAAAACGRTSSTTTATASARRA